MKSFFVKRHWKTCSSLPQTITRRVQLQAASPSISKVVDLRSDTKSLPTPLMIEKMISSPIGDDVFDEDPTVKNLEQRICDIFNKESALFVPSGTMGNLLSVMSHCDERHSEIIVGNYCHIHASEGGNTAYIANVHSCVLPNKENGEIDLNLIEKHVKLVTEDPHATLTKVINLENSHNRCGGKVLSKEYIDNVKKIAIKKTERNNEIINEFYKNRNKSNNNNNNGNNKMVNPIAVHMDGARIFNAAISLGYNIETIKNYVESVDSLNICFSKGLHCPVGSILTGNFEFIRKAKRYRKALGGGMRQSGMLAAACLVSLDEIVPNLYKTHECCNYFYNEINNMNIKGLKLIEPQTNILMFETDKNEFMFDNDNQFLNRLKENNLLVHHWSENVFRLVFYNGVTMEDTEMAVDAMKKALA